MIDLREGQEISTHALILSVTPFEDNHRIVKLFSPDLGKFTALARNAARSRKRFGAGLEPMNHVKANVRVSRAVAAQREQALYGLDSVELQSSFLHLRASYSGLETALFVLRLIGDLIPDGHVDAQLFRSVGRLYRDLKPQFWAQSSSQLRVLFWLWMANHLGYGRLLFDFFDFSTEDEALFFGSEFSIEHLERLLLKFSRLNLDPTIEVKLYREWTERSGLQWTHFERWLGSRSQQSH
jgi:hypothetical protein